jgi:excisionase family DNA binding protein
MTRPAPSTSARASLLIDEAAAALGVSRRTIYYRIRQGRLATIRTRGGSQRVLWSSITGLGGGDGGSPEVPPADLRSAAPD